MRNPASAQWRRTRQPTHRGGEVRPPRHGLRFRDRIQCGVPCLVSPPATDHSGTKLPFLPRPLHCDATRRGRPRSARARPLQEHHAARDAVDRRAAGALDAGRLASPDICTTSLTVVRHSYAPCREPSCDTQINRRFIASRCESTTPCAIACLLGMGCMPASPNRSRTLEFPDPPAYWRFGNHICPTWTSSSKLNIDS